LVKNNHMKKTILFLALIFTLVQVAQAQINFGEYSQVYVSSLKSHDFKTSLMVYIKSTNDAFASEYEKTHIAYHMDDSTLHVKRSENQMSIFTFDNTNAQFFLHGVDNKNSKQYEFRVLENLNKVIIPWTNISKKNLPTVRADEQSQKMCYLGGYKTNVGNKIIVDIRRSGTDKIMCSAVICWVPIKPVLVNIYTVNELNDFLKRFKAPGYRSLSVSEKYKWKRQYANNQLDSITSLPKKLKVASTDNSLIFYLKANIYSKDQVEYALIKDNKIVRLWGINEFDNSFIWLKNLKPGEYILRMRYSIQRKNVTEYPFVIETPWNQSAIFNMIAGILSLTFLGGIIFLILFLKQKKKTVKELAKKEKLQLELKAIYAQLNPHFVFNALSSIQGLINKKDIEGANMYLSDFARLMRDSMTNNNKEQTSLNQEIITLETYLKLEQLRFGFKFEIKTNDINIYETEIPSLLLQPLIENAVKHGVSSLKEDGMVGLLFSKTNNDMIVEIQDNGGGFAINEEVSGYGLKLTRDRIKLLNQIMKGQSIELDIKGNTPSGTKVSLQFKNWFL
jgi:two-component system, LytTR family, sensor kinase